MGDSVTSPKLGYLVPSFTRELFAALQQRARSTSMFAGNLRRRLQFSQLRVYLLQFPASQSDFRVNLRRRASSRFQPERLHMVVIGRKTVGNALKTSRLLLYLSQLAFGRRPLLHKLEALILKLPCVGCIAPEEHVENVDPRHVECDFPCGHRLRPSEAWGTLKQPVHSVA